MILPTIQKPKVNTGAFNFGGRGYQQARKAPGDWRLWLRALFPNTFTNEFTDRHVEFWQWVDTIELGAQPSPTAFVAVWPRGGGKTTTAETAVIRLGAKGARKFVLYVRGTQDKANESVKNIADKLESRAVSVYYPRLSDRDVSKYGHSKGWRVDMLRTADDFNIAGLGLDAAVRGVKIEDYRPDLIVFDDIDGKQDSPQTIKKKVDIITTSILPAGSSDVAVMVVQNMIHAAGIVTSFVENTAEFLYDRFVSGPYQAVDGLEYQQGADGTYTIVAGTATWDGQSLDICESQINTWGLTAFLKEAQHEIDESGGLWDHVEFRHVEFDKLPSFERGEVWIDPAVTTTNESDSMAICAGGSSGGRLYVVYSWEQITSPEDVIRRGILIAFRYGFESVGVETDQGGDTWISVYKRVCEKLLDDPEYPEITDKIVRDDGGNIVEIIPFRFPTFRQAKAGAGHGSKVHRNGQMMVDYEHGKVIHVIGTHKTLEKSLKRFPNKPLDLADAAYWLWYHLLKAAPAPLPKQQPTAESRWDKAGMDTAVSGTGSRWKLR